MAYAIIKRRGTHTKTHTFCVRQAKFVYVMLSNNRLVISENISQPKDTKVVILAETYMM